MIMRKLLITTAICASILATACSVHKVEVQQGNVVNQEMRGAVEIGMTKRQVQFVMGTPLLIDPFHPDRWDYIFTRDTGKGPTTLKYMALFFEDDKLVKIESDLDTTLQEHRSGKGPQAPAGETGS